MTDIQKDIGGRFEQLLRTELSRKEFLQYMGVVLIGLVGITGLLKTLHRSLPSRVGSVSSVGKSLSRGYGRGGYGK